MRTNINRSISFTKADWQRIQEAATKKGMTPHRFMNEVIGAYMRTWVTPEWDGLLAHGGGKKHIQKPPVIGGNGDNKD